MTRPAPSAPAAAPEGPGTALAATVAVALGSLALAPVFATPGWLPPVLLVVLTVGLGGVALRAGAGRLPDPVARRVRPLVPLGQLALVLAALTVVFAPDGAWAGVVPTTASVQELAGLLADGTEEIREQATPALPLTGLVALTAVFVALVALAVDLLAVPARQPALGGLGLLVLYCVPVSTITGDVALVAFLGPAIGFALLLWADQRARLTTGTRAGSGSPLGTGTVPALRTGAVALVLGVLLSAVVPTLGEGSLAARYGTGGNGTGTALDPVAEMRGQLSRPEPVDLLSVRADGDLGYLRSVVLDRFTAEGWQRSNADSQRSVAGDASLAPLPDGVASQQVTARISAVGHDDQFLPVPYAPQAVDVAGDDDGAWRFDRAGRTVFGRGTTTAGLSYVVTADRPEPRVADLAAAPAAEPGSDGIDRYLELPELDPSVTALVTQLTSPDQSPYERVRAVLGHLTDRGNGFVYSLSTQPGTSGDDLADFLERKRGYCEQYAGAMAVLVRAAGVPSRVVLGYTRGAEQPNGARVITSHDAHAWVEAYFPGQGWIPFDPTPIEADRAAELPWAPRADAVAEQRTAPAAPNAPLPVPAGPTAELDRDDQYVPLPTAEAAAPSRAPWLAGVAGLLLVAALAALPGLARHRQRLARLADGRPAALWDELLATATDLGVPVTGTATTRQLARQVTEQVAGPGGTDRDGAGAGTVEALRVLTLAEERAVYGPPAAGAADPELRAALGTVRQALVHSVGRRQRMAATVWPASTLADAGRWVADRGPRRPRSA
ncbi:MULTISPECIES: transglutaminase family protein [unclassified Modestobacter]